MNAVECLNKAFEADPNAINALMINRVPCNLEFAHHPLIPVDESRVLNPGLFQVGALGLVNGVLAAHGLPLVAAKWDDTPDAEGRHRLLGFTEFTPGEPIP